MSGEGAPGHVPVMTTEIIRFFSEGEPGNMVDGTAGQGGHLAALLSSFPGASVLALDRDPEACDLLRCRFGNRRKLRIRCLSFSELPSLVERTGLFDSALFDLGLSSAQLDDPERGFSHSADGPLDMRFDRSGQGRTASDILNRATEKELADLLFGFGQERRSRRLAREIMRNRPLFRTGDLARVVGSCVGRGRVKVLSRVFQALRIAVNDELRELDLLCRSLAGCIAPGGRVAFLTFHSLEDRIVKLLFRDSADFEPTSPPFLEPSPAEVRANPRARSAKLRLGVRL